MPVAPISGMPLLHITEAPVDTWLPLSLRPDCTEV